LKPSAPADLLFAGDPIDPLVIWVRPQIVVEIRFTAWTDAGRVRHPVCLGMPDKPVRSMVIVADALPELADEYDALATELEARNTGQSRVPLSE
jgi:ATP-dependent DNA ligase